MQHYGSELKWNGDDEPSDHRRLPAILKCGGNERHEHDEQHRLTIEILVAKGIDINGRSTPNGRLTKWPVDHQIEEVANVIRIGSRQPDRHRSREPDKKRPHPQIRRDE